MVEINSFKIKETVCIICKPLTWETALIKIDKMARIRLISRGWFSATCNAIVRTAAGIEENKEEKEEEEGNEEEEEEAEWKRNKNCHKKEKNIQWGK